MATLELYVTGDQIATYGSVSVSGKGNGTKVKLGETSPLGSSTDVFKIVISNVAPGDTGFESGQVISVYAYPSGALVSSSLGVDPNAYDGRATSDSHFIFDGPGNTGIVIDLAGVDSGSMQFGPGINPTRYEELPFSSLETSPPTFPCFVKGTLIETVFGPLPIETLRVGDRVRTADRGLQTIRWIGKREVPAMGRLAPITFEAGAIGNHRALRVSPQHRMVMNNWQAGLYFGEEQVFVAAKHLVNGTTIRQTPTPRVTYVHMIFDCHEVVFAEGIASESLHLGRQAIGALDRAARAEILAIFPELADADAETARRCLRSYEAELLASPNRTGLRSSAA